MVCVRPSRHDTELSASFERWVSDGETKIRNRPGTVSDVALGEAEAAASLYQKGDLPNAEVHYRDALPYVSSPMYYEALAGLGNIAVQRGQRDQAQDFYERLQSARSLIGAVPVRTVDVVREGVNEWESNTTTHSPP